MSSQSRRQQSFGGVAALFGEDEQADATHSFETANEIQQFAKPGGRSAPSFGGVASMFGDEDGEPEPSVTLNEASPMGHEPVQQQSEQNHAQATPTQNPTPGGKPKQSRQSSFGGVAALFGDEDGFNGVATDPAVIDKEATKPKTHSQKSSFGGVASLFSPAEEPAPISQSLPQIQHTQQNTQPPPVQAPKKPPQQNSAQKSRQQSFGGVATLFSSMGDEDEMKPVQSQGNNISSMFDPVAPAEKPVPQQQNNNPSMGQFADYDLYEQQTNSEQPPAPPKKSTKSREKKSKRDPSISGVFSLFGDDQIPEQASPQMVQQRKEQDQTTLNDLTRQKREFAETADKYHQKIELEENRTKELEELKIKIAREIIELRESKILLIRNTEMEMRKMRKLMADPDSAFQT